MPKFEKVKYGYGGNTFVKKKIIYNFNNVICIKIKPKTN